MWRRIMRPLLPERILRLHGAVAPNPTPRQLWELWYELAKIDKLNPDIAPFHAGFRLSTIETSRRLRGGQSMPTPEGFSAGCEGGATGWVSWQGLRSSERSPR